MLIDINQNSVGLLRSIQNNGCLFLCFAEQSPLIFEGPRGIDALNYLWVKAHNKGVIREDDILLDHEKLAQDFFALNVRYDPVHHDGDEAIPEDVSFVFGKYFWKLGHFVIINKNKEVTFDSLGDSFSVKNGALQSMRWYYANKISDDL